MTVWTAAGRVNQKTRTRAAIVEACRRIIGSGLPVTMPAVAREALVSEPTAYRYFPDLVSLLTAALDGLQPDPVEAMAPVTGSSDPVERIAFATEVLLRHVTAHEGAVRAMISATIARPNPGTARPGLRFGLIDQALDPLADVRRALGPERLTRLKQDLTAIVSAEALFCLIDLNAMSPDDAVASLVRSATTITRAALSQVDMR